MKSKFNWKSVQNLISSSSNVGHAKGLKIIQSLSIKVEKDWEIEFSLYSIVFSSLQYKHKIGFSEISTPQKNYQIPNYIQKINKLFW